jgi:hypothetical protein
MNQRDIINLIDRESELLGALEAWARDKTMEERAAKVMRMTAAIGKVPLFLATGHRRAVEATQQQDKEQRKDRLMTSNEDDHQQREQRSQRAR